MEEGRKAWRRKGRLKRRVKWIANGREKVKWWRKGRQKMKRERISKNAENGKRKTEGGEVRGKEDNRRREEEYVKRGVK